MTGASESETTDTVGTAGTAGTGELNGALDRRDARAALQGDDQAFGRLVERHQHWIGQRMSRFARDPATREELVQDVFVQAWRGLGGYRGEAPFAHWLSVVATRVGYRFWRDRDRAPRTLPLADWDGADTAADPERAATWIHEVLARMAPEDRLVLTLVYLEDLSMAEAATHAGWSTAATKMRAMRARKKLKATLEGLERPRAGA